MAKRIDAKNLDIYYGKFLAVSQVNFTINPRSVTAFIGPSGCGKSTVLRTLNRMHEVIAGAKVEGTVELDGEDIYGSEIDPVNVRRTIGMVFQRPNPFPTMSIYDNVVAGLKLEGKRRSKNELDGVVEKSLRAANLWEEVRNRLSKPGAGLSGGQQQRLCIARAIAVEPQVLLMDEPCSALDPDLDARHRGPHPDAQREVHDRDRHAQHAAGGAGVRSHWFLQPLRRGKARRACGDGRYREDLFQPHREADRGLHLGPVRLIPRGGTPCATSITTNWTTSASASSR